MITKSLGGMVAASVLLAAIPGAGVAETSFPVSPRLAAADLWQTVAQNGAPLIEYGATPDAPVTVTFLWRGTTQKEVELSWPVWTPDRRENHLTRLGDSDVWFKTVILPPKTRLSYQLAPDPVRGAPGDREAYRAGLLAALAPDPLNPKRMGKMSLLKLNGAPDQPYIAKRPGVPEGHLTQAALELRPGTPYKLTLYRPHGVAADAKTPLVVVFDADRYLGDIPTPTILDNMIADGVIPPVSAVLIENASRTSRGEDLGCDPGFADALAGTLVPFVRQQMAISTRPADIALAGSSFGGLMSACTALRHPETFGAVLSQSGSFWWNPKGTPDITTADGHHVIREVRDTPVRPTRLYLDAGVLEQRAGPDNATSIFATSQALFEALKARGYKTTFRSVAGGHDDATWRGTLSDGLIWLFGGMR